MKKMNELDWAAWVLMLIGSLNWGLVALFKFDVVQTVLGTSPMLAKTLYLAIGLSGAYWLYKTLIVKK